MNKKMYEAINIQINRELFSAYLYLSMKSYFDSQNLAGFAHWMDLQAKEEYTHAMKMFSYLNDRGEQPKMLAIDAPEANWDNPLDVFEHVYNHEQNVTKMIHDLVELAISVKDYSTQNFLQWFVNEQVEEEASADAVVQKLKMLGNDKSALLYLDSELSKRSAPADIAKGEKL